ncbi:ATPase [Sphaerisporangium melleum]|uniref:ATPase n=1 Tax=Sphaerisporangium melleum TaxID=321316 RepID=A0A917QXE6_9ACTN|nr:ATP-binding protein [Sphaerisporangium melleum]GGK73639.1 ATPase [Sphaerisporangium melleum]GII70813.1 ATPase [Sphaerisporangium melleum]
MTEFVGRDEEIAALRRMLNRVTGAIGQARPGQCVLMRGRRRIGKSALAEEFVRRSGLPSLYFTAARASAEQELEQLLSDVAASDLVDRELFTQTAPANWSGALQRLADAVPDDAPSVLVIDEVPYLMERVDAFEGLLQRAWDRFLSRKPVLLLLIGSDLSMMEALNSYERPFHQRGTEMVVKPLNPADIQQMLDLDAKAAFDAALVTGGLPLVCAEWPRGASLWEYLHDALLNPVSALLVSGERTLAAEFPVQAMPREVLEAIGSGERTFVNIARAAGGISHTTLTRATDTLTTKGIVTSELPLSTRPSKERRYRIGDPYLRFWLYFLRPHMAEIERRRGDLTLRRIAADWSSWRGRAIEPLVREALARLLPDGELPAAEAIGAYWTRSTDVELDIVGADRAPIAKELRFAGSIKWLESAFDDHDLRKLILHRAALTDAPLPLVAVSRSGASCGGLAACYGPEELIAAWRRNG